MADQLRRGDSEPAAVIGTIESRARRFETPCGAGRMVWRCWGRGRPLVLLHGGSGSWLHWITTIPALESRFSVWVPDMPGFGESDLPPEPYTIENYAAVVEAGLRSLLPGTGRFDMVGFSLGASVASRLARLFGERLGNLVFSGANFFPPIQGRRIQLAKVKAVHDPVERERALRHNLQRMMVAHEENIDALAVHLYSLDVARRRLPRVSFSAFTTMADDLAHARFQGRFTVISGVDDQVIGHGAEAQGERLRSLRPDAGYHALERAGHWVMYEGGERYNRALLDALEVGPAEF